MADKYKLKGMRKGLTRYGDDAFALFLRKSFIKGAGYARCFRSRSRADTGSDFNPCHGNSEDLVAQVRAGVLAAGIADGIPTVSLHESFAYQSCICAI